jgi:hypothetical protein
MILPPSPAVPRHGGGLVRRELLLGVVRPAGFELVLEPEVLRAIEAESPDSKVSVYADPAD